MKNLVLKFLFVFVPLGWNTQLQSQERPCGTVNQTTAGCFKLANSNCSYKYPSSSLCDRDCSPPSGDPGTPSYKDPVCPNGAKLERVVPASYSRVRPALVGEMGHSVFIQEEEVVCVESRPCSACVTLTLYPGASLYICSPDPVGNWADAETESVLTPTEAPCNGNALPDNDDDGPVLG